MTAHLQSEDLQAEAAAAGRLMEAAYVQFKQTGAPEHSEEAVRHLRRRDAVLRETVRVEPDVHRALEPADQPDLAHDVLPLEVLHRVASMASGGMDTLPHNGAVITLLAVTGLTHRQAYKDIFAITLIKTLAVFFVIALFYLTGWV